MLRSKESPIPRSFNYFWPRSLDLWRTRFRYVAVSLLVLSGILVLLSFQLIGELLQRVCSLPLPGPVIGMFLLTVFLLWKPRVLSEPLHSTSRVLFEWWGLLFVPAGAGVIANLDLIRNQWVPILVGLVGSTLLSLIVTAYLMHRVSPRAERDLGGDYS
ncbi:MAG TPA: CidA/LrgA family protein [Chthoniobacterales bacterium]|nr:CidA/LrgA family protein [Chthoniobacterales bacterium]